MDYLFTLGRDCRFRQGIECMVAQGSHHADRIIIKAEWVADILGQQPANALPPYYADNGIVSTSTTYSADNEAVDLITVAPRTSQNIADIEGTQSDDSGTKVGSLAGKVRTGTVGGIQHGAHLEFLKCNSATYSTMNISYDTANKTYTCPLNHAITDKAGVVKFQIVISISDSVYKSAVDEVAQIIVTKSINASSEFSGDNEQEFMVRAVKVLNDTQALKDEVERKLSAGEFMPQLTSGMGDSSTTAMSQLGVTSLINTIYSNSMERSGSTGGTGLLRCDNCTLASYSLIVAEKNTSRFLYAVGTKRVNENPIVIVIAANGLNYYTSNSGGTIVINGFSNQDNAIYSVQWKNLA